MDRMPPEEFRRYGHEVVDWIAEYLANPKKYPVLPSVKPGELTDALPATGPEHGEPMEAILADFDKRIVPAITHWNHPGFMGYFAITSSGPGILGEMLSAALNANGMLWQTSPAVTELEQVTLAWLRQWMGLADPQFGVIYDTASTSTMHAIAAAREFADPETRTSGGSRDLILYTSEQAHSSVEKGAIAIGVGQRNVRKIPVDAEFRMRPDALAAAIEQDRAAGCARSASFRPWGPPRPRASIRSPRSPISPSGSASGCTWTRLTAGPPRSRRAATTFWPGRSAPIPWW